MFVSSKAKNAERIVSILNGKRLESIAVEDAKETMKGRDICKLLNISNPYFEQIVMKLKEYGVIETIRGCNGGYKIAESTDDKSLFGIIELFTEKEYVANRGKIDDLYYQFVEAALLMEITEL